MRGVVCIKLGMYEDIEKKKCVEYIEMGIYVRVAYLKRNVC